MGTARPSIGGYQVESLNFVMTYPCYVQLGPDGRPISFNAEGFDCIALFTDDDLSTRFARDLPKKVPWMRVAADDRRVLLDVLNSLRGRKAMNGRVPSHVAIDPTLGKLAKVYPLRDFLAQLARSTE